MPNLYLFLHGLAVVYGGAGDFEVVLPKISGHQQKAGSWLAETSIAHKSVLQLRGVTAGNAEFSRDYTIYLPNTTLTDSHRAATLRLPKPKAIFGLLHAKADPPRTDDYVAKTKDSNPTRWTDLATIQVLLYDYANENELSLEGHYWEPSPIGGSTSLHIISTSEVPEGRKHENETEDVMHMVLDSYPGITYAPSRPGLHRPVAAPWFDPLHPNYGDFRPLEPQGEQFVESTNPKTLAFSLAELEHPTLRLARLGLLGRLHQSKRHIADMWGLPSPLGDRTSNCMTLLTAKRR
jgi:hypothetical protein